jgi:AcrR family transcriptional regulator
VALDPDRTEDDATEGSPRRRMPASERRATILEAALRTFALRGYEGAPMDEIAAAAGVSKAVVYDHVASKRELYTELLESIQADLEAVIERALQPLGPGADERVHAAVAAFYGYVEGHPAASRLLFLELQSAAVSPLGLELEQRVTDEIAAALGGDLGLFDGHPQRARQLQMLAVLIKAAVQGLASWWFRNPEAPRDQLVELTVALVWPAIERARAETTAEL